MFRVLVLGASGMLARDIIAEAPQNLELTPRTSQDLDVTNRDAVDSTIASVAPDVVINCAAYTDVDRTESDRDRAFAVNGDAPGLIAAALARQRPRAGHPEPLLVHYSTDYVFDGSGSRPYREGDSAPLWAPTALPSLPARGISKSTGRVS